MKILFLDFDGVLNPIHYENMLFKMWKVSNGLIKSKDEYGMIFFDQSVNHLWHIVNNVDDLVIVISSTWRKEGEKKMKEMWYDRNMPSWVHGITPVRKDENRGKEIKSYLTTYGGIENYAILDDRVITGHKNHFIKTNGYYGLTREDADKVISILNL